VKWFTACLNKEWCDQCTVRGWRREGYIIQAKYNFKEWLVYFEENDADESVPTG
jgi:hypothetical protein